MGHLTVSASNIVARLTIFLGGNSKMPGGLPGGGGGEWAPLIGFD